MLYDYILVLHVELGDNLIVLTPKRSFYDIYVATYDMSVEIFPGCTYVATYVTSKNRLIDKLSDLGMKKYQIGPNFSTF